MQAFVEHLSGVIRVGEDCDQYGKPFDYAVAFSSGDGKTAILKALIGTGEKRFTCGHAKAILRALKEIGLRGEWERIR